jgi:hypothetical protein
LVHTLFLRKLKAQSVLRAWFAHPSGRKTKEPALQDECFNYLPKLMDILLPVT